MSMEPEEVFAEEAQEEIILSQIESNPQEEASSSPKLTVRTQIQEAQDGSNETSPLLMAGDNVRKRQMYQRAGKSYERAINEPWTGAHGQTNFPWYKRPHIFWLLAGFFPFCIAFGGIIVPKTYLVLDLICRDYFSDQAARDPNFTYMPVVVGQENQQCRIPEVQSLVSYYNIYSDLLSGIPSALVAPFFGALSDRIGRKKVIVVCSMGALIGEIMTIIVGRNPESISVYWTLLGAFVDGLCGSFTTALALAFAYAADTSSPEQRSVAFGYFHGTLFSGIALGPIVAGLLIKSTGNILVPFYFALSCHLFFMSFTVLIVPESLSKERQAIAREKYAAEKSAAPSGQSWLQSMNLFSVLEPLGILRPTGEGTSPALRRNLFVLAAIDTMMFGVAMGTMRIILIYAEYRYGWSAVDSSFFLSACNVVRVSGLLIVLPLLTRIFRGSTTGQSNGHRGSDMLDLSIIKVSVVFDLIGYLGYAFSPIGALMFVSGMLAALGGIGSPTLQSSLTKHIPADKTGQILGASGLLHALSRVVAPLVFNLIYAKTVKMFSGFVFLCLGSIFVIVFIMSWFLKPNVYLKDQSTVRSEPQQDERGD